MNIGASVNDFDLLIGGLLAALLALVVLFGIAKLVGALFGVKSGVFALLFVALGLGALFYGSSLYLDSAGEMVEGLVVEKAEHVSIRREGDWRQSFRATIAYRLDGRAPSDALTSDADQASAGLSLTAPQYDALQAQQTPPLRLLKIWNSISLVRLSSISTRDLVPLPWIIGGIALLIGGWAIRRFVTTTRGCLMVIVVLAVAAIAVPGALIYRQWLAMEDLSAKPLRAQGVVSKLERITRIDPLPCYRNCSRDIETAFDVPQPYDIVQLRFTPQGATESVIAVDAADVGTFSAREGSTVELAYAAATPRAVQLIGAGHSHHWKNLLAFLAFNSGWLVLFAIGLFVLARIGTRRKRSSAQVP